MEFHLSEAGDGKFEVILGSESVICTLEELKQMEADISQFCEDLRTAAIVPENESFEQMPIPEGVTLVSINDQNNRVVEAIESDGKKVLVYFSVTEVFRYHRDTMMVADILDQVAVKGKVRFMAKYEVDMDELSGKEFREYNEKYGVTLEDYESEDLENPTWLEVAKAANDMLLITGDYHYIFLEGIREKGEMDAQGGPVKVYHFLMGS